MTKNDLRMFLACVAIWGTTWLAITWQLGRAAPEISVALRFGLSAGLLAGFCYWRGHTLRFPFGMHLRFAAMGFLMFTVGYLCVYYAELYVVSGLVAVGYCISPLINQYLYRFAFGRPISRRVTIGGLVGLFGIGLIYLPELSGMRPGNDILIGAVLTLGGVFASSFGNLVSTRLETLQINVWQRMTFSMAWGAAGCLLVGLLRGVPFHIDFTLPFLLSLAYLSIFGSIAAFAIYLTLIERIGAGRSGYISVMTTVVALTLSSLFENFVWQALTVVGIVAAVAGNIYILAPARRR